MLVANAKHSTFVRQNTLVSDEKAKAIPRCNTPRRLTKQSSVSQEQIKRTSKTFGALPIILRPRDAAEMEDIMTYMSLQEFAWLGATMSGVGVIVSVIYVSIQISHNTRAVRASAFQQVVNSFAAVSADLARDKNLVDLFVRGGRDFASLGEVERTQYSYMLLSFLRRAESVVFQTEIHMLHNHHWCGIRKQHQGSHGGAGRADLLERNQEPAKSRVLRFH